MIQTQPKCHTYKNPASGSSEYVQFACDSGSFSSTPYSQGNCAEDKVKTEFEQDLPITDGCRKGPLQKYYHKATATACAPATGDRMLEAYKAFNAEFQFFEDEKCET